jgi:hypothetical protein
MNKKKIVILLNVALMVVLFGCGKKIKEAKQKKMYGVNGEAVYVFNKENSISMVFKESLSVRDFSVLPKRDTIKLGETFVSLITAAKSKYTIHVFKPEPAVFEGTDGSLKEYTYNPTSTGVYEYTGEIQFDTTRVAFEYKFVVVE